MKAATQPAVAIAVGDQKEAAAQSKEQDKETADIKVSHYYLPKEIAHSKRFGSKESEVACFSLFSHIRMMGYFSLG